MNRLPALRVLFLGWLLASPTFSQTSPQFLTGQALPSLPNPLGVAGPFAGIHEDALIVAGGANFSPPIWESEKSWTAEVHVLVKHDNDYVWKSGGTLPNPVAYGATVSSPQGIVCMGGNDGVRTLDEVMLVRWNSSTQRVHIDAYPSLPQPCAFGAATLLNNVIYLAGGQSGSSLESAMANFWALDLSQQGTADFAWQQLSSIPGPTRALNLVATQHNGFHDCVYVISGRRQMGTNVEFLRDVWEYSPLSKQWRERQDVPQCVMAGTAIDVGQSHLFVLGGATGDLFDQADALRDQHPGFPKKAFAYHTITNTWTSAGSLPQNQVTTVAVKWDDGIVIPTGEIRPRVRTAEVWRYTPTSTAKQFGVINYTVLAIYLLSILMIGVAFAKRSTNTDHFFRGGKRVPWWAAGCSIFATMLSSLTFTGIPSKAYAQNWVYAVGNFLIPFVAIIAVYVALPFFRRIDATTAYQYLERRFDRTVRLFGSACFTLFHIFRMAVVMSLTGLALAVATPLTPTQAVILMGVLSIAYCTMGGIEAVIWTDTLQTVVLLGGAMIAIVMLIMGGEGSIAGFLTTGWHAEKFKIANLHYDATDANVALWVILLGGFAQNLSSYTADQAVVQRYMTTPNQQTAARSIWLNAVLAIPATLLFFCVGTALFAFYQAHPDKLDPTTTTDQIFPLFIAREMPIGLAGLIVAAIFAAAQSTVSTSMNSTATTVVTDFIRPLNYCTSERGYLAAARWTTVLLGLLGTILGLLFVTPEIKSLFDTFIKVIGLFMGVLGGLFVLGTVTTRTNAVGALTGAFIGGATTFSVWWSTEINGYLYTAIGISTCVVSGYLTSIACGRPCQNLDGLTIYTLNDESIGSAP